MSARASVFDLAVPLPLSCPACALPYLNPALPCPITAEDMQLTAEQLEHKPAQKVLFRHQRNDFQAMSSNLTCVVCMPAAPQQ